MLNAVIRFSLHYRPLIVFVSLLVLLYGGYVTSQLPIDVLPDLDRPRVVVMTECPGLAPEEVETLVTFPLEARLLGATGVQAVRSQSVAGLSAVYVEFDWGTNIYIARQTVQERIATVGAELGSYKPVLGPISSIMGQIMHVGMHRRQGPGGGELAAVPGTTYLAELVHESATGRLRVFIWDPRQRDQPARWEPVSGARPRALTWEEGVLRRELVFTGAAGGAITATVPARDRPAVLGERERRLSLMLTGKTHDLVFPSGLQQQMALRTTADWVVRPRLLKIAGLAQVVVMGGERKQYQVLVDPGALTTYDVTLQQVEEAVRKNNLNTSGGFASAGEQERPIRIFGRLGPEPERVLTQLRELPLKPTPQRSILLQQVARIVEGPQLKRGDSSVNGWPAVVLTITKQPHVDTRALTDEVNRSLRELEAGLPADVAIDLDLFQLKNFIDTGVFNVAEALIVGAFLVLIVLFLFLLNFRTTFISLTAIPISLALTGLVFKLLGWASGTQLTINIMTLGGIAVALGELVDDAIVDVENIFRRLRERAAQAPPTAGASWALEVIYSASVEIRGAIVYGTAMVILVFVPLFALGGIEGRLFTPLGLAYITSILASLLVALTLTPVLSYYLLPQARATQHREDSPLLGLLKRAATPLIRLSLARAGTLLLVSWLLVGLGAVVLSRLGADFLPPFDEGSIQINVSLPPGSSLQASNAVCNAIDARLHQQQKSPDNPAGVILQFARRTGRAELDEHVEPVSGTEYIVTINPLAGRKRNQIIEQLQRELKEEAPGVDIEVEQPLAHLISHMLSGVTAQIAIKIQGDDLAILRRTAEQLKAAIAGTEGLTSPVIEAQRESDELHIRIRPEQLAYYHVDRAYVADFISTALGGAVVAQIVDRQRRFDVLVRLDEPFRSDFTDLGRLRLELPGGRGQVALGELVDIGPGLGPNVINRENARRQLVIRCNVLNRDLASVVADIQGRVKERVRLSEGYAVEYGGQFESQRRATLLLTLLALGSFLAMFVVLYTLYPSVRIVLQILNALPAAFIGGVAALVITGQSLSVASMVGFISLAGIAARNGILLVSHYFHLMNHENEHFTPEMVLRGSLERLAPVLMTALTAGIAVLPLVVVGHAPGREILYPVATVILGGLVTSTLGEYLLHPGLFWNFSGKDADRISRELAQE